MMVFKDNLIIDDKADIFTNFTEAFDSFFYFRDPKDLFHFLYHIAPDKIHIEGEEGNIPRHFIFANIQCLRCGLCCKNYEVPDVVGNLALKLEEDGRYDLLYLVDQYIEEYGAVSTNMDGSCFACRKVRNKPYFYCRLNNYKTYLPTCKQYLCSKSIPVSNINYSDVDELLKIIGLKKYIELIKID